MHTQQLVLCDLAAVRQAAVRCSVLYIYMVIIGLLYKAYPNVCQQVLLRPRPYSVRGHRLLYAVSCPGNELRAVIPSLYRMVTTQPGPGGAVSSRSLPSMPNPSACALHSRQPESCSAASGGCLHACYGAPSRKPRF